MIEINYGETQRVNFVFQSKKKRKEFKKLYQNILEEVRLLKKS